MNGSKSFTAKNDRPSKALRKKTVANRARHRLLSIRYDVENFCRPILLGYPPLAAWPLVANERCGTWYAYPFMRDSTTLSCYFKSTDGHVGTWNFSLKRLNLNLVRLVSKHGGCVVLDASASKELPDSFSRTIPIWAAVLNRIAARYRRELGLSPLSWDHDVLPAYTPDFVVPPDEHELIQTLIDARLQTLYQSEAIVDPFWLATTLTKPLRPFWITPHYRELPLSSKADSMFQNYFAIVCLNCSDHSRSGSGLSNEPLDFLYTAGAADDHESWARRLTPQIFWDNASEILEPVPLPDVTVEDATDHVIDAIVQKSVQVQGLLEDCAESVHESLFDEIGTTGVCIGTRRAGRPPECWKHFDAILNVTDQEYPDFADVTASDCIADLGRRRFYLQVPVAEGKRDKHELERWMAVGIVFVFVHARRNRRVLIHCAQGKDRSVALAVATFALFCDAKFPLRWNESFSHLSLTDLEREKENEKNYIWSGLSENLVQIMMGPPGRDRLLSWVHLGRCKEVELGDDGEQQLRPLATKASLRVILLLIQQDREKADPSRSTMQKLHRFFMSKLDDIGIV
jgi:tRNA A64-2'-O-ribosylphosphate transferase